MIALEIRVVTGSSRPNQPGPAGGIPRGPDPGYYSRWSTQSTWRAFHRGRFEVSASPTFAMKSRRESRIRAALLSIVWILPGVWCAGHLLAHELESEHHEPEATAYAGDRITGISGDHDHGHAHPESAPVVSTERAKERDSSVLLLAAAGEPDASKAMLQTRNDPAVAHAVRSAAMVSRPRAPPIS